MLNIYELKTIRKELKVLYGMINVFIDVIINGGDYSDNDNLINNAEVIIEKANDLLIRFQNLIYLMIENKFCENTETELKYVKGLLCVLKCCLSSSIEDYDENGVYFICFMLSEKCKAVISNINETRLLTYPDEDINID